MREYTNKITLAENGRGIWTIDPIMGCKTGILKNEKGCFSDCYAARISKKYGYDFSKNVLRDFSSEKHLESIIKKINKLDFPFVRMGNSGDPSEDWDHTISILKKLKPINKQVVIITRHWNLLSKENLSDLKKLNVCINTSISAIDDDLERNINQYKLLKKYCVSVLRCVSFDFNLNNKKGFEFSKIQDYIFEKYDVLDTVFRTYKNNKMVLDGVIKIKETKFLGKKCYVSKRNKKTYFGNCLNCIDKCGFYKK